MVSSWHVGSRGSCCNILNASVAFWKRLFPKVQLWEAGCSNTCKEKLKKGSSWDDSTKLLSGDENTAVNDATLDKWIQYSNGANFDVVIDQGGRTNCESLAAFNKLWPKLSNGGLYFFENLSSMNVTSSCSENLPTMLKDKIEQMVHGPLCEAGTNVVDKLKQKLDDLISQRQTDFQFLFCQRDACVLRKK